MKLKDFATIKLGYYYRSDTDNKGTNEVKVLRLKDFDTMGNIDYNNVSSIFISTNPAKHFLSKNEVIISSRVRFAASVYNPPAEHNFIASSLFLRIQIENKEITPEYLALYLNSISGQTQMLKKLSGGTAIQSITKSELENIDVFFIPETRQKQLCDFNNEYKKYTTLFNRKIELQSQLFNYVITKNIGGANG
jgi:restriction endonuclease S subunit